MRGMSNVENKNSEFDIREIDRCFELYYLSSSI